MSRPWLRTLVSLAVGISIGAVGTSLLAARASRVYVQIVRLSFTAEQESRLKAAWQAKDLRAAERHAACGVELEGESHAFDPAASIWSPGFTVLGFWAHEGTRYPVSDRTGLRALAHARLGRVLEEAGRSDEAVKEYATAGRLGDDENAEKWRKAAEVTLGEVAPRE